MVANWAVYVNVMHGLKDGFKDIIRIPYDRDKMPYINAWIINRFMGHEYGYDPSTDEILWDYEYIGKGMMAFGFKNLTDIDLVEFKMRFG